MAKFHEFHSRANSPQPFSGTTLPFWSRQQKIARLAGFVIFGVLLALSACSKQASKPALVGVSNPAVAPNRAAIPAAPAVPVISPVPAAAKKVHKRRPAAIVSYNDPNSGISFQYPRKFELASGQKSQPSLNGSDALEMNFTQPGGAPVATVELPGDAYPGTDFSSAFFHVNLNRDLSEDQCSHFAFVDTRNADGEPIDTEKVKVGSSQMEKTSDFSASAVEQAETEYYHRYESGICYEFVLGVGTAGYGTRDGAEPVNREEVFARLEKILATVRIEPVAQQPAAALAVTGNDSAK